MSTTITVVIIAIVVIALIVVVALVQRSKKHPKTAHMGLPELGALSTDGSTSSMRLTTTGRPHPIRPHPRVAPDPSPASTELSAGWVGGWQI